MIKTFNKLEAKFVMGVLVIAFVIACVGTFTAFVIDTTNIRGELASKISALEQGYIPAIEFAVWGFDHDQIRGITKNLMVNDFIEEVEIVSGTSEESKTLLLNEKKNASSGHLQSTTATLYHEKNPIGSITIKYDDEKLLAGARRSLAANIVLQSILIVIVAMAVLYLVKSMVITHLQKINAFLKKYPIPNRDMDLLSAGSNKWYDSDEINHVIVAINSIYAETLQYQDDLIKAKNEAEKANRLKSLFLASMSHELRTPLNVILGATEVVGDDDLSEEGRKYLGLQVSAGEHLRHLIDDILDLSKAEAGELHLLNAPFDLRNLLQTATGMLRDRAKEGGNELVLFTDPSVPQYVDGDSNRIMQIIFNILGNSCKFTKNGKIMLSASMSGDQVVLVFYDNGVGIPEDKINSIFLPFRQVDEDRKLNNSGSGIGLAVCLGLVKVMGGTIKVESERNRGTSFVVTLPLKLAQAPAVVENPSSFQLIRGSNKNMVPSKKRILVAEDTEENVMVLMAFLKKHPYEVTVVTDGEKAVEAAKAGRYDLILMDLQMPRLDGYEATRAIRQYEATTQQTPTPIVALTAYAAANDLKKCLDAGCDNYLTKPFKRDALLRTIASYLPHVNSPAA